MLEKAPKGRYETDYGFIKFFFQSISGDNDKITEKDLDAAINTYGLNKSYAESSEKLIQKTQGGGQNYVDFDHLYAKM